MEKLVYDIIPRNQHSNPKGFRLLVKLKLLQATNVSSRLFYATLRDNPVTLSDMAEPMAIDTDTNRMEPDVIDPLDWTVDQVVAYLCHSPLAPLAGSSRRPPVSFEATLQKNQIDGVVLLSDVDNKFLRDDLHLESAGQRSWVLAAIRHLQKEYRTTGKLLSFIPYSKH
jgi:hypothetical protein